MVTCFVNELLMELVTLMCLQLKAPTVGQERSVTWFGFIQLYNKNIWGGLDGVLKVFFS